MMRRHIVCAAFAHFPILLHHGIPFLFSVRSPPPPLSLFLLTSPPFTLSSYISPPPIVIPGVREHGKDYGIQEKMLNLLLSGPGVGII
jgi:hypothetical protein